jgi:predicted acetyltransferase
VTFEVRLAVEHEFRALSDTVASALLFPPRDDAGWEQSKASWAESINYAAWDGERCVGNVSQFVVDTTVPGGATLPTGAVSRVGVLSTHRRRGLATTLMHRLIDDSVERGLALMSLRASEAVIYERYGFGLAGEFVEASIDPIRARPVSGADHGGSFRFVAADELLATLQPIYGRSAHRRPGFITRPDSWWRRYFADALTAGKSAQVVVHRSAAGVDDGYASYATAWRDQEGPGGKGEIHEVIASSDAAELALWQFLFDVDLVRVWRCEERPVDDVLRSAITDRRAYAVKSVDDEQWLRLIDIDRSLAARTYNAASGSVTIAVTDDRIGSNNATWEIDADGARRTDRRPDLATNISGLSAAYLGGPSWRTLTAVGKVVARSDESIAIADTLFSSHVLPFCGSFF